MNLRHLSHRFRPKVLSQVRAEQALDSNIKPFGRLPSSLPRLRCPLSAREVRDIAVEVVEVFVTFVHVSIPISVVYQLLAKINLKTCI